LLFVDQGHSDEFPEEQVDDGIEDQSEEADDVTRSRRDMLSPPLKRQRNGTPLTREFINITTARHRSPFENRSYGGRKGLVDPSSFTKFKYNLNQHDIGKIFNDFQVAGAKMVNDSKVSVTLDNMSVSL